MRFPTPADTQVSADDRPFVSRPIRLNLWTPIALGWFGLIGTFAGPTVWRWVQSWL